MIWNTAEKILEKKEEVAEDSHDRDGPKNLVQWWVCYELE